MGRGTGRLATALILGTFSIAAFAQPGAQAPDDAARDELLKVNSLFNRDLFDLAIPRYEKILERYPDFAERSSVHFALALSHDALAAQKEAARTKDGAKDETALGQAREHRRRAAQHAREALRDRSLKDRRQAMDVLAANLLRLGAPEEAAKVYGTLLESATGLDRARAAQGLGDAQYEAGAYADAAKSYRIALDHWREKARNPSDAASEERDRTLFHLSLALWHGDDPSVGEALRGFEELSSRSGPFRDESSYMAALARERRGDVEGALAQFRAIASSEASPRRAEGLYGAGAILFRREDWEGAVTAFEELVSKYPQSEHAEDAKLHLGRALLELGRLRSGARLLLDLRTSPRVGADASLWLARAYASKNHHDQAAKILADALSREPTGERAGDLLIELAIEQLSLDDLPAARESLETFLLRHSTSSRRDHAEYLLAFALHRAGEHESALERMRRFGSAHPESRFAPEVARLEAESLFLSGQWLEARAAWERVAATIGASGEPKARLLAEYRIAEADFHLGKHDDCRKRLDALAQGALAATLAAALREDPVFESFHFLLGDASYQLGEHERATVELRRYLERESPRLADDAHFKLAHALQLLGRPDEARKAYAAALSANAKSAHRTQIRFELGQLALEAKDHATAKNVFEQVIADDPAGKLAPHAWHFLGWIAQHEGDHERAIAALRKLVDGFPDHELEAEGLYLLALSLRASGRLDEARNVLERLERKHPDAGIAEKVKLEEAVTLARAGRHADAIPRLEALRSATLPPTLRLLLEYELAWSYRRAERMDDAIAAYRELLSLAAKDRGADVDGLASAARLELGELEFDAGRIESARTLLSPLASDAGPLREKALYRLAWCHYREDETAKLEGTWTALSRDYPTSGFLTEIALLLARAHVEERAFAKASALFEKVERMGGSSREAQLARVSRAECLNEERRFEESRKLLESFHESFPSSPYATRARFAAGQALESLGELEKAIDEYRRATEGGSEIAARAQFQIGQCLAAREKYEDAIVEFLQVPVRFAYPEWSSRALLQVAGCFEALESFEKAREYYTEVIREHGTRAEAKVARERLQAIP